MKGIEKVVGELFKISKEHDVDVEEIVKQYYKVYDRKLPYEVSQRVDDKITLHNQRRVSYIGYNLKRMSAYSFQKTYMPFETINTMNRWYKMFGGKNGN